MENAARLEEWLQSQMSISGAAYLRLRGLLPAYEVGRPVPPAPVAPTSVELVASRLYKLREVADATGISVATLRRACLGGQLPFVRANKGATSPIRICGRDVKAWLAKAERENKRVLSTREVNDLKRRAK